MALAAGCSSPTASTQGGASPCESATAAAAAVDANSDTIEQLDPVIRACGSVADLRAASAKYPAAFDGVDPVEFVRNRCAYGGPSDAPLCALVK